MPPIAKKTKPNQTKDKTKQKKHYIPSLNVTKKDSMICFTLTAV